MAYDGPPELTWARAFTTWDLDVVTLLAGAGLVVAYAVAARRSGGWPMGRRIAFYAGAGLLVLTGVVEPWGVLLGSRLGLRHAAGDPADGRTRAAGPGPAHRARISGGSRADRRGAASSLGAAGDVPAGRDGTGDRGAVPRVVHGLVRRLAGAPWLLGLTHLLLVVVGFAFFGPLLEGDESRRRLPWVAAAAVVFVETVLDSIPGIVVWLRGSVLAPAYWSALGRPWGRAPLADQRLGGLMFWGIGEVVGLPILLATVVAWMRADAREAARIDAELDAQRSLDDVAVGAQTERRRLKRPTVRSQPSSDASGACTSGRSLLKNACCVPG